MEGKGFSPGYMKTSRLQASPSSHDNAAVLTPVTDVNHGDLNTGHPVERAAGVGDIRNSQRRFAINLVANGGNFLINILIGIWFTPYLIHHLGVSAYGLIPLALSVVTLMSVVPNALNGSVGRFLTIAFERRDAPETARIFTAYFFTNSALACVLLVPAVVVSLNVNRVFSVPDGYDQQFIALFLCTAGFIALTILGSTFSLPAFCLNRFEITNSIAALGNAVRIIVIVTMFTFFTPRVWHFGFGLLAGALSTVAGYILASRLQVPGLRIKHRMFRWETVRQFAGIGGWMVVSQIGTLLYLGIDLMVVNRFVGVKEAGSYGAVLQWSGLLRSFSWVMTAGFVPTIFALYARKEHAELAGYTRRAVRFVSLLLALPVGLICGLSQPLLTVWLGREFAYLAPLLVLLTFHLSMNLGVSPLTFLQSARGKVRTPGIVTCLMGCLNVVLAILLAVSAGWGVYGVAAAGAVMLTVKSVFFEPVYSAWIIGEKWWLFSREILLALLMTSATAGVAFLIASARNISGWTGLVMTGMGITPLYAILVWVLAFNKEEREKALLWIGNMPGVRTGKPGMD